jgi:YggT family protein
MLEPMLMLLGRLLDLYSLVVLVAVITSWIRLAPDHPVVRITGALTEPLLGPIRRVVPALGGMDFSPMLLLFGIQLARRLLFGMV